MKTIWMVMKWTFGIVQIIVCMTLALFTVYVICPTMEKINHKLGKEIKNAGNY